MEKLYSLFGQTFFSNHNFDDLLLEADSPADFTFTVENLGVAMPLWENETTIFVSNLRSHEKPPGICVSGQGEFIRISIAGVAVFEFQDRRVICYPAAGADSIVIRNYFLSVVLSCWLERKGITVLHASSVLVNGHAIAFLAHHGHGKSSIAVSFIRNGYPLITDDLLAIKREGSQLLSISGFPKIRLCQNELERFCSSTNQLRKVDPAGEKYWVPLQALPNATFHDTPAPIGCFYLLERRNTPEIAPSVDIVPVSARDAVIEIMRYSFAPRFANLINNEKIRFDNLSTIAMEIPVRRLLYPSGYQHIPFVLQEVLSDIHMIS